ncbi:hypothetical protein DB32_008851 [Sandaracinus amylolyticus]|uniref:Uncharacterized protein n=1 Tax=Sandaracinus amylolyticus TaxID=927083 RepID=A0A0F6WAS8_9BACT|nr:hypothetical protein DB32_008851 [Sandaracinus amylolyticus]
MHAHEHGADRRDERRGSGVMTAAGAVSFGSLLSPRSCSRG